MLLYCISGCACATAALGVLLVTLPAAARTPSAGTREEEAALYSQDLVFTYQLIIDPANPDLLVATMW